MSKIAKLKKGSIAQLDLKSHNAKEKTGTSYKYATALTGKTKLQLIEEISQCQRWPGKITRNEYFAYRLYEKSPECQKEYISEWLHWAIHENCEDAKWSPLTVDKMGTINLLTDEGIPTIKTLAIVDGSNKQYEHVYVHTRVQHYIGPHNATDGSRGTNHGYNRACIG